MNYASVLIGFVLATLITVGARAEPPAKPGDVAFTVHDNACSETFCGTVFGWRCHFADPDGYDIAGWTQN